MFTRPPTPLFLVMKKLYKIVGNPLAVVSITMVSQVGLYVAIINFDCLPVLRLYQLGSCRMLPAQHHHRHNRQHYDIQKQQHSRQQREPHRGLSSSATAGIIDRKRNTAPMSAANSRRRYTRAYAKPPVTIPTSHTAGACLCHLICCVKLHPTTVRENMLFLN